ncbi:MAG: ABC transporter substrate-binding protein [Hyphomicrobiaceae bacterium]|nr:ABC transporter substrate-binding protein [Hyphomicrobiaceae bacterium]
MLKALSKTVLTAAAAVAVTAGAASASELVIPFMDYRTGPYSPNGIPYANGKHDYFTLINERDGGVNGVKLKLVSCETAYNTKRGVECYEKLKGEQPGGALLFQPHSTGITYQLIPKASVDQIPILSVGYGRTSAANGRVFKWVFNFPGTYWSQASGLVKYIGQREGGLAKLKGKKIYLVYHNSAYGKEPIRTLQELAKKHGFTYKGLPVDHPGQEQKATWLTIRRERPDWVLMWGWGVMNQVAIKEAASVRFPMDHFIGVWWSGSENDVKPAGAAAKGYLSATFHGPGAVAPVHQEILKHVYGKGKAVDPSFKGRVGEVLYNRGMIEAMWVVEAIRAAQKIHKTKIINAKMLRDGLEALNVDAARLKEIGFGDGFAPPVKVSCSNHEGTGNIRLQQWDGSKWKLVSDWISPDRSVVDKLIEEDSAKYAKENKITPRACK